MATQTTTITNQSQQVVTIIYNSIDASKSVSGSSLSYYQSGSLNLQAGKSVTIETARVDITQLNRLRDMNLISYS